MSLITSQSALTIDDLTPTAEDCAIARSVYGSRVDIRICNQRSDRADAKLMRTCASDDRGYMPPQERHLILASVNIPIGDPYI